MYVCAPREWAAGATILPIVKGRYAHGARCSPRDVVQHNAIQVGTSLVFRPSPAKIGGEVTREGRVRLGKVM